MRILVGCIQELLSIFSPGLSLSVLIAVFRAEVYSTSNDEISKEGFVLKARLEHDILGL